MQVADLKYIIPMAYASMEPGTTRRVPCPVCEQPGKTFTITRKPEGFVWNCFRDSCDARGGESVAYTGVLSDIPLLPRETRYMGEWHPCIASDYDFFDKRFGINSEAVDDIRTTFDSCYLLPVYRPDRTIRGYIKRHPTWAGVPVSRLLQSNAAFGGPKTINYLESADEVPLSWHPARAIRVAADPSIVVLVEDWCSAERLACLGINAVALLGSSLSDARVRELQQAHALNLTWAPDPDAIGTALQHCQKYAPAFRAVRVMFLDCDPKDYQDSDKLMDDLKVLQ